jgi:hypothetical protein
MMSLLYSFKRATLTLIILSAEVVSVPVPIIATTHYKKRDLLGWGGRVVVVGVCEII